MIRVIVDTVVCFLLGLLITLCFLNYAKADTIKIAIIDTGYKASLIDGPKLKLCDTGHYDFATNTPTIGFTIPHGTGVASIIAAELQDIDYCAIIYNVYGPNELNRMADSSITRAYAMAANNGVTVINASFVGFRYSIAEREAVRAATKHAVVFVAAGNDKMDLDVSCLSFPTCFDIPRVYSVGALSGTNTRAKYSNYGSRVKLWYTGDYGTEHGTSYATPRALSDFVLRLVAKRKAAM